MKKANPSKSKIAKAAPKTPAKVAVKTAPKPGAKTAKPKVVAKAAKPAAKVAKPAAKAVAKAAKPVAKAVAKVTKTVPKIAAKVAVKVVAAVKPLAKAVGNAVKVAPVAPPAKAGKAAKAPAVEKTAKALKPMVEKPAKVAKAPPKAFEPKVEVRSVPEEPDTAEDVVLTDADGNRFCRTKDCDRLAEVDNYCRYHYILLWKNIQIRRNILQEGKLGRYVEELTARYPDKFLEILKKDLRSEKDFLAAIQELEIDESAVEAEFDDEEAQSDLFEIQRVSDAGSAGDRSDSDDRF